MDSANKSDNYVRILSKIIAVLLAITALLALTAIFILPNLDKIGNVFNNSKKLGAQDDFITVLDVGEADCILICSNGQKVLVDAGRAEFDNELCAKIRGMGIKSLDAVYVSHLHSDHVGGLLKVSQEFKISNLILPDLNSNEESAFSVRTVKNDVLNSGGKAYTAVAGMVSYCGDFEITVLGYYGDQSKENNRSVVLMVRYNNVKTLLTGDIEAETEKQLVSDGINFDCDILKVAHHGSNTSTTEEFLRVATPQYAVISCGADNEYSHPDSEVIDRLSSVGADIKRTDIAGDITFHFYSDEINPSSERLIENSK